MRILYLIHRTSMDGSTISFINMIKGMKEKGVEVFVAYADKQPNELFIKKTEEYVTKLYHVPFSAQINRSVTPKRTVKSILKKSYVIYRYRLRDEIRLLREVVIEVKPDIIHTNVGVIHSGFFTAKAMKIPHVWHLREYQTEGLGWSIRPTKNMFIKLLKKSNVITVSEGLLQFFRINNSEKAKCIYNGCFQINDISFVYPKDKYFLCSSRIDKQKGQDEAIKAFSRFATNNHGFRLIIAGNGNQAYIQQLKALANELGCGEKISFIGYIDDIRPLMDKAYALIVASNFEGLGRMTAEAAFRGCLVLGKNNGGTREILEQTQGGFLYDNGEKELAEKMTDIIHLSEYQYREMALRAQKIAQRLFSIETSNESLYTFYERILERR